MEKQFKADAMRSTVKHSTVREYTNQKAFDVLAARHTFTEDTDLMFIDSNKIRCSAPTSFQRIAFEVHQGPTCLQRVLVLYNT